MTSTADQTIQLEKPLEGLMSTQDIIKADIGIVSTAGWNFAQIHGPVRTFVTSYIPAQVTLLCEAARILGGIAIYLVTPKSDTGIVANWPVGIEFEGVATDACVEFCDSRGLLGVLRKCLNQARIVFSTIAHLSAELDFFRDEEIEDSTHVVIRIEVNSDQRTALSEYDSWVNWVIQNISPDDSNFFTLTVHRM
jgi:hypothetical protein